MKKEDGGYYAVKGFVYQFDYTISQILNQADDNTTIKIEQEQDLSYENYIVQVKYYETEYTPSQIKQKTKDTAIKLLKEFSGKQSEQYCIYSYFKGKSIEVKKFSTIEDFDKLLGKEASSYHSTLKENFINNFTIVYAEDFKQQFLNIIIKIQEEFNCNEAVAIQYHALIRNYVFNILVNNSTSKSLQRFCSKREVHEFIKNIKSNFIYAIYEEILGEKKYFKYLKTQFPKVDFTYKNYLFIGSNILESNSFSISNLIKQISDRYYSSKNIKAEPFNIVLQKEEEEILSIKKQLIRLSIKFNDGYEIYNEFSEESFNEKPLVIPKKGNKDKESSFSIRFISYNTFNNMKTPLNADRIYSFGNSFVPDDLFRTKVHYFAMDEISINRMFELFN
jgi:hypothetical protein